MTGAIWAAADQLNSGLVGVPGGTEVVAGVAGEGAVVGAVALVGVEEIPRDVERAGEEVAGVVVVKMPLPPEVVVVDPEPSDVECWCDRWLAV